MRAKATFLDGVPTLRKSTYSDSDFTRPEDAELDPALAEILIGWRAVYATAAWKPSAQDVKHTLRELRKLADGEIERALRSVDPWTEAELWRLPAKPTADEIRAATGDALHRLRHVPNRPGRPTVHTNDVWMGVALVQWWEAHTGRHASVTEAWGYNRDSDFLTWATDKFNRAGRVVSTSALKKSLQQSLRTHKALKTRV